MHNSQNSLQYRNLHVLGQGTRQRVPLCSKCGALILKRQAAK